jgi:hypothetical protein
LADTFLWPFSNQSAGIAIAIASPNLVAAPSDNK